MSKTTKYSIYLLPIIIGLGIIFGIVITYSQIYDYQQQLSQSYKNEIKGILEGVIDRRESRLQTISNGMIGFFESSNEVTPDEFSNFSNRIFSSNAELVNIAIIDENQIILYSFPQSDMMEENSDTLFSSYPTKINGINTMNFEFPMDGLRKLIISVPFDYFISTDIITSNQFKLILFSPLDNNQKLYQLSNDNGIIKTDNIEFTQKELEDSLEIHVKTNLYGHIIKKDYVLKYSIWTDTFEPNIILGQLLLIIGITSSVIIPITVYKTNNTLRQKNHDLEQIKISKDKFLAMITHELKTPLVPIQGYADILLSEHLGKLTDKQKERIDIIKSSSETLLALISDLLDAQKLELGQLKIRKENTNIKDTVTNTIKLFLPQAQKNKIEIISNVQDLSIEHDQGRIKQVITNLIKNSLTAVEPEKGKIEISMKDLPQEIQISVKDNGIGIPIDKQKDLFKEFYQVDTSLTREMGGSGLGLSICKGIVENHGGAITVKSTPNQETIFTFTLPKKAESGK